MPGSTRERGFCREILQGAGRRLGKWWQATVLLPTPFGRVRLEPLAHAERIQSVTVQGRFEVKTCDLLDRRSKGETVGEVHILYART